MSASGHDVIVWKPAVKSADKQEGKLKIAKKLTSS